MERMLEQYVTRYGSSGTWTTAALHRLDLSDAVATVRTLRLTALLSSLTSLCLPRCPNHALRAFFTSASRDTLPHLRHFACSLNHQTARRGFEELRAACERFFADVGPQLLTLRIEALVGWAGEGMLHLPSLHSCTALRSLTLKGRSHSSGNLGLAPPLPDLHTLDIRDIDLPQDDVERLLAGCPSLEDCTIQVLESLNLSVLPVLGRRCPRLRRLRLGVMRSPQPLPVVDDGDQRPQRFSSLRVLFLTVYGTDTAGLTEAVFRQLQGAPLRCLHLSWPLSSHELRLLSTLSQLRCLSLACSGKAVELFSRRPPRTPLLRCSRQQWLRDVRSEWAEDVCASDEEMEEDFLTGFPVEVFAVCVGRFIERPYFDGRDGRAAFFHQLSLKRGGDGLTSAAADEHADDEVIIENESDVYRPENGEVQVNERAAQR